MTIIVKRAVLLLLLLSLVAALSAGTVAAEKTTSSIWLRGNPQYLEAYRRWANIHGTESDIELSFSLYQDLEISC